MNEKILHPLCHPKWIEFNCKKWNVSSKSIRINGKHANDFIEAFFYLQNNKEIVTPPLNTYLFVHLNQDAELSMVRANRHYLELCDLLIQEMKKIKLKDQLLLPPGIKDVRPWQWNGYLTNVRYTLKVNFPFAISQVHSSVKKNINKAERAGVSYRKTYDNYTQIIDCFNETQSRQGFKVNLYAKDLEDAFTLNGADFFRTYAAFDISGKLMAFRIVLSVKNGEAIDWLAGTSSEYLNSGVTQGLLNFVFQDLTNFGIQSFDFAGAGMPSIAQAKADWGAELVPYYIVNQFNLKWVIKVLKNRWKKNNKIPAAF